MFIGSWIDRAFSLRAPLKTSFGCNFAPSAEKHVGPKFVADFEEIADAEERALLQRDAFERADYLLKKLNVR